MVFIRLSYIIVLIRNCDGKKGSIVNVEPQDFEWGKETVKFVLTGFEMLCWLAWKDPLVG